MFSPTLHAHGLFPAPVRYAHSEILLSTSCGQHGAQLWTNAPGETRTRERRRPPAGVLPGGVTRDELGSATRVRVVRVHDLLRDATPVGDVVAVLLGPLA